MRCLSLAAGLANRGARVEFICRAHDGNLIDLIKQRGFQVISLPATPWDRKISPDLPAHAHWLGCDWQTDARQCRDAMADVVDLIIVDHYALDQRWETALRDKCARIMCIDDLADRPHDCDLLLDQSLGRNVDDYSGLIPEHAQQLLGPKYALLRPEFSQWRTASLARRKTPKLGHILITMGGVDANNITGRVLSAVQGCDVPTLDRITVLLGPHAPWRDDVHDMAAKMKVATQVLSGVDNVAELMTSCDLAIGAGGSTTWERCSLGVPTIQIELALNQKFINTAISNLGAARIISMDKLDNQIAMLLEQLSTTDCLKNLSARAATVSDGCGVEKTLEYLKWS